MYEYPFIPVKVINGHTVKGVIDLGFSVKVHKTIELMGVKAPLPRLDPSISDKDERQKAKVRGKEAKERLRLLLKEGLLHPEGLIIETFFEKRQKRTKIMGDIKYIYARDLYNFKEGHKPWIGWKRIGNQLLIEELVDIYEIQDIVHPCGEL